MGVIRARQPITDADIPAAIARDTETTAAITAHVVAADPHPIYLTEAEGDARYLNTGGGSGIAATIATSAIESALRKRFKSNVFVESHYLSSAGNGVFPSGSSNGGFAYTAAEIDRPGILGLSTGSNSAGFASSASGMGNNSSPLLLDEGNTKYFAILKIPTLRDAVNNFVVELGFQSAGSSIGLDACCFVYDSASNNWQCHTRNNSDLFTFTSNITVVANQWYEMGISVTDGIATFSINSVNVLNTSQKLPLTRMVGAGVDIRKTAGTTGRDVLIDYQSVEQTFSSASDELIAVQSRQLTDSDIPATIARNSEVASAITAHTSATDPHSQYLTQVEGDVLYRGKSTPLADSDIPASIARDSEITSAIAAHISAVKPHPYLTQAEGDALYRAKLTALTDADIPASIARDSEVTSAIAAHSALGNPHGQYPVFARFEIAATTNDWQGGTRYIPHNLDVSKIRAVTALVLPGPNLLVPPGGLAGLPGYMYTVWIDGANVCLRVHPADSAYILGKPVIIIIDAVR
jgi:hypothetical protein